MPKILYTCASGYSSLGGHTTTVHLDLGDLALEVNTILIEDEELMALARSQWNECAREFNNNRPDDCAEIPVKGDSDDVEFEEFATKFPSECGWGWDVTTPEIDGNPASYKYINITIHPWNGKRYDTDG